MIVKFIRKGIQHNMMERNGETFPIPLQKMEKRLKMAAFISSRILSELGEHMVMSSNLE
jgi:hypothetical protein